MFSFSLYGFIVGLAVVLLLAGQEWWLKHALADSHSQNETPSSRRNQHSTPQEQLLYTPLSTRFATWLSIAQAGVVVGAIVGARTYHLLTDWPLYQSAPFWQILAVWNGGLGIFGAVVGGALGWIGGVLFWKVLRPDQPTQTVWAGLDALALMLPLAQALGRWGNFANQELYGLPTSLPWGIWIAPEQRLPEFMTYSWFHPLFLYESLGCLLLGIFLFYAAKNGLRLRTEWPALMLGSGLWSGLSLWGYGSLRFGLELLRAGTHPGLGGLTSGQWSSVLFWLGGLFLLTRALRIRSVQ